MGRPKRFVSGHNGRKYRDPGQHKREWNHRNRKKKQDYKKKMIRRRKITLVEMSGGKCLYCGYEFDGTNECAFDFHHIDASRKKFPINKNQMNKIGWDKILEEFKKCEILCARCHRIVHNEYKED